MSSRPIQLDLRRGAAGRMQLPGSKSLSIRAMLLAALAQGTSRIQGLLASDDTAVMMESLRRLGVSIRQADSGPGGVAGAGAHGTTGEGEPVWLVEGTGGRFHHGGDSSAPIDCFVGNSGLTIRTLLPAIVVAQAGTGAVIELRGVPRMHERPIGDLVDGLRSLGAQIEYLGAEGYPPLRVTGVALKPRDEILVKGSTSSQFLTGLLQAAPHLTQLWGQAVTLRVDGPLISRPYVDLSIGLLQSFGIQITEPEPAVFQITPGGLISPGEVAVEGDASSASYSLAAGLLGGGPVRVMGAGRQSLQGDVRFADALAQMGANIRWGEDYLEAEAAAFGADGLPLVRGVDLDCNDIPDAAMTLVVVALYAKTPTRLRNIGSWRVKETDRIAAMATEARKLGATVEEGPDYIVVTPPARLRTASIQTYDDHRVAMSFALASFVHAGDVEGEGANRSVTIQDPACVNKTFPSFFEEFAGVCANAVPVIAIDGPTASGKGTVAARVAAQLGFHYLDSGALYRLLALASLQDAMGPTAIGPTAMGLTATGPTDEAALAALAAELDIRFKGNEIWLRGARATDEIRAEAVGNRASEIAALPAVRSALLRRQRDFARLPGLVADGRDMGSVVFPQAIAKVFLTASAEARAERRYKQLIEKGFSANLSVLLADLQARDARDASRAVAPLKFIEGSGVTLVDSTGLSIDDAVQAVIAAYTSAQA